MAAGVHTSGNILQGSRALTQCHMICDVTCCSAAWPQCLHKPHPVVGSHGAHLTVTLLSSHTSHQQPLPGRYCTVRKSQSLEAIYTDLQLQLHLPPGNSRNGTKQQEGCRSHGRALCIHKEV